MTPNTLRLYAELSPAERQEDAEWYAQATEDERRCADELTDLWYRHKDDAERFKRQVLDCLDRSFWSMRA